MRYVIGLDLGIASVGWSVINLDQNRVEDLGVRAFQAAETPKDKSSLAAPRREARSARRRLRRRALRLRDLRKLIVRHGMVADKEFEAIFATGPSIPDPWQLRAEGLSRLLTGSEFARALYHIAKHRGFKSNRLKAKASDSDDGVMLQGVNSTRKQLEESGYRTIGELFYNEYPDCKRNRYGEYKRTVGRDQLVDEVHTLFDVQRRLHNTFASEDFETAFVQIFTRQRPFASGFDIQNKVGRCQFEPDEMRAPKAAYSVELASLYQKLANLRYFEKGTEYALTQQQVQSIIDEAHQVREIKYTKLRKILKLDPAQGFKGLNYGRKTPARLRKGVPESTLELNLGLPPITSGVTFNDDEVESKSFFKWYAYCDIKKSLEASGVWPEVVGDNSALDQIAVALSVFKTDEDMRQYLSEQGFGNNVIEAVLQIDTYSRFGNLSLKALGKMMPFYKQGKGYTEAAELAGYLHAFQKEYLKHDFLPVIQRDDVTNPVVFRALTQARKVVNAIIRLYGAPTYINVELARDLGKSREERREIEKRQKANYDRRQSDTELFEELFPDQALKRGPSRDMLDRIRLYNEQDGRCAYSLKEIDMRRLLENNYVEIDHIVPYSRCYEDRPFNKVLVLTDSNRNKGNRTPFEYFGSDVDRWAEFEAYVNATYREARKRFQLLRKNLDPQQEQEFMERNLNDTRYISRFFVNYLKENLRFADDNVKLPVRCVNGAITSKVRYLWGLDKNRSQSDLHHAMDACVVAAITPAYTKRLTDYYKARENRYQLVTYTDPDTGEIIDFAAARGRLMAPQPWPHFAAEVVARLSDDPAGMIRNLGLESYVGFMEKVKPVIVSRMPYRKMDGPIHEETIRSAKNLHKGYSTVRKQLTALKATDLPNLVCKDTDQRLYCAIKRRLNEHNGDGKKAFATPFYKPTHDGMRGPEVKGVKVMQVQKTGVELERGLADNGGMVRVDVFQGTDKRGKKQYHLVPVYTSHWANGVLPDKAIVAYKDDDEWTVMDESCDFLFSLYSFDLLSVKIKDKEIFGYYLGTDRATGAITICPPNKDKTEDGKDVFRPGIKTALLVEKYQIDVLGRLYKVRHETRRGLAKRSDTKPSPPEGEK